MRSYQHLYVLDYDGILSRGKTVLERMGWDMIRIAPLSRKLLLYGFVAPYLKTYKKLVEVYDKENLEKRVMERFESVILRLVRPPYNMIESFFSAYAKDMIEEGVKFLEKVDGKNHYVVVLTSAPAEAVENAIRARLKCTEGVEIIGNMLKIEDGKVVGFRRDSFFGDRKGKRRKLEKYLESLDTLPSELIGVGDSHADLGVAEVVDMYGGAFYTIKSADDKLISFVEKKFGLEYVKESPEEIFAELLRQLKDG